LWASAGDAATAGAPDAAVLRKLHQTIKKVSEDIPALSYNTAIAAMMEYLNVVRRGERAAHRDEIEPLVQLVAPFAPHLAEELWERFGHGESVFDAGWPAFDSALAAEETVTLAVQVNGKTRGTIGLPAGSGEDVALAAALADQGIAKFVAAAPRKVIFIPGRLLNIVT
ncbi:MAG: class I tRNA ligase family protein, partial [Gemmatimonadaceae bacterium]